MSALGSRHCRGEQKSAFVRFTLLATILGVGPIGREVPLADIARLAELKEAAT